MVESFLAVPLHFTTEFLGFLVMAGAAVLLFSRPELIPGESSNRITAGIGFALLAAGQVAHGGGFENFEVDGAQPLVVLRTVGFLLILVGVTGGLRISAGAVAAWRVEEVWMLAPAVAAMLVAAVALRGSRGAGPKSLRRLSLGAFLFGLGQVAGSAAPTAEFGAGVVSVPAYVEHGLEAAAFLAFAAWLRTAARASIRTRFVTAFAALLVAVVLALASALTGVISSNVQGAELADVKAQVREHLGEIREETEDLKHDVEALSELVRNDVTTGPTNLAPLARAAKAEQIFEFDFVFFMTPRGRLLGYAADRPLADPDAKPKPLDEADVARILGSAVIDQVVRNNAVVSASPARVGGTSIAIVAAHEITDPDAPARRVAIVAVGKYLDALTTEGFKPGFASIVVDGEAIASELPGKAAANELVSPEVAAQVQNGQLVSEQTVFGGKSYATAYGPIESAGDAPVATLVVSNPARVIVKAREGLTGVLFIVAMAAGAVALVLAWVSGRRITRPIQELTATASEIREGNLEATASVAGEDEVGRLGETFNEMTSSLLQLTNDLRDAAVEEHQLRSRIETIIQSMADGLIAVDADKNVLAFNRQAENMTGQSAEDALGLPVDQVLTAKDSQGNPAHLPVFDLEPGAVDAVFVENAQGKPVPVTMVSAPLTAEDGSAIGGVLVMRDMTREREVERMKTEFLSNISHELRTPLTPIKGYAEILGRKDIPPHKVGRFVEGILESTSRLERIVQLLVDFSAMEAGRLEPRSKTIDMSNLVQELAGEWSSRSERHVVVAEVDRSAPAVLGDERLLRRSLEEVLDNAVKFSPYGGTVRLEVRSANGSGRRGVIVTVSDEGIGIPPEDIDKVFSDFHQLDGSETRAFGGLGLGLAFVQRIVQAHDGNITVDSRLDEGTTVTIDIPAAADN
ncbi:MAG: cell wall metabolism sensor histidine kinase WalK [Actinobacteria bacterium]|nr:cell wall metabolism sensor histidine kinase WalK [Actinomycetota bacterium]